MLLLEFFWNISAACALLSVASFFHRAAAMSTAFAVAAPQVTTPGIKANLVGIGMSPRESLNKQPQLSFEAFEATNCRFFAESNLHLQFIPSTLFWPHLADTIYIIYIQSLNISLKEASIEPGAHLPLPHCQSFHLKKRSNSSLLLLLQFNSGLCLVMCQECVSTVSSD